MIAEVYKALKEAGASEESATAAAQALAVPNLTPIETRLAKIESDLDVVKSDIKEIKTDTGDLKADMRVLKAGLGMIKWLLGGLGFGIVLLLIRTFWPV